MVFTCGRNITLSPYLHQNIYNLTYSNLPSTDVCLSIIMKELGTHRNRLQARVKYFSDYPMFAMHLTGALPTLSMSRDSAGARHAMHKLIITSCTGIRFFCHRLHVNSTHFNFPELWAIDEHFLHLSFQPCIQTTLFFVPLQHASCLQKVLYISMNMYISTNTVNTYDRYKSQKVMNRSSKQFGFGPISLFTSGAPRIKKLVSQI